MIDRFLLLISFIGLTLTGPLAFAGQSDTLLNFPSGSGQGNSYVEGALYIRFGEGSLGVSKDAFIGDDRWVNTSLLLEGRMKRIDSNRVGGNNLADRYGIHGKSLSLHVNHPSSLDRTFRMEFDRVEETESLIQELLALPGVEYVERVPMYHPYSFTPPDDPFHGEISDINTSWHLYMIGFQELYGKYKADPRLKVAVVDNAVWAQHEDLQIDTTLVYDAYNDISGVAMPPSYVSPYQIGTPEEPSSAYIWSHGTHCAGLIGALNDNGIGIASLASGVSLMGVRVSDNTGNNLNSAPRGVLWAVDHGAKVINMSFGSDTYSITEEKIYQELVRQGIILVAAAGNNGVTTPSYPAHYEGVISVGSVNSNGKRSSFSNFGDWVDVWAPGGYLFVNGKQDFNNQIFSTTFCVTQYYWKKEEFSGRKYDAMVGTSMATPLVTSAVALLLSYYPHLNMYEIQDALRSSSVNGYIYVPKSFELLESGSSLQVRQLQVRWDTTSHGLVMTWKEPLQSEGVLEYEIFHNGNSLGSVTNTSFSCSIDDTSGYFGVKTRYQDKKESLILYTRIGAGPVSVEEVQRGVSRLTVTLDPVHHVVHLHHEATGLRRIDIFNIQGVRMLAFPGNTTTLDVSGLRPGVYVGRAIDNNGQVQVFRFIL